MAKSQALTKKVALSKANAQMTVIISVAAFVTVFCLVAAHSLLSLNSYQARVTSAKETAHQQLVRNIQAYNNLKSSYVAFVNTPQNVLGSSSSIENNSLVILDALPPSYDFPGLASTLAYLLSSHGYDVTSITGTDNQISQQNNNQSTNPTSVSIPFSFTISNSNYATVSNLTNLLQASIRPFVVDTLNITGGSGNITITINAHTYYQPSKSLSILQKVVK